MNFELQFNFASNIKIAPKVYDEELDDVGAMLFDICDVIDGEAEFSYLLRCLKSGCSNQQRTRWLRATCSAGNKQGPLMIQLRSLTALRWSVKISLSCRPEAHDAGPRFN
jgi:hypothetical protein